MSNFNWRIYKELNPDLVRAGLNTEIQFLIYWNKYGYKENRKTKVTDITPDFDWEVYKELNKDLKLNTPEEYELHWLSIGNKEDRPYKKNNIKQEVKKPAIKETKIKELKNNDKLIVEFSKNSTSINNNIIFITPVFLMGGVENWLLQIIKGLKKKFTFSVFITASSSEMVDKNMYDELNKITTVYRNIKEIDTNKYNLAVHVLDFNNDYCKKFNKNIAVLHVKRNNPNNINLNYIISTSRASLISHNYKPYNKCFKIIHNSYTNEKVIATKTKYEMYNLFKIPHTKKVIMYLDSKINKMKRPELFVDMMKFFEDSYIGVMIGGDKETQGPLINYIKSVNMENRIIYQNYSSDTANLLNMADYYVATGNKNELFQTILIECGIMEIPFIMAKVGIYHDFKNVLEINTVDITETPLDFYNKIMMFEKNIEVKKNQINKIKKLFVSKCNPEVFINKWKSLFNSFIKRINSFDIFDTLIKNIDKESIFQRVGIKCNIDHFNKYRIEAEKLSNGTFDSIYDNLKNLLKVDDKTIEMIRNTEIAVEKENITIIRENMEKVKNSDILISNTYYDSMFLLELLEEKGLNKNVLIYTSTNKQIELLSMHNIKHHYGVLLSNSNLLSSCSNIYPDYSDIENLLIKYDYIKIANLIRYLRLANPHNNNEIKHKMWLEQCQYNIPILIFSSIQLRNTCKEHNFNKLLFSSRDGCLWIKIFDKMYKNVYETIYFNTSRKAYYTALPDYVKYIKSLYTEKSIIIDLHATGKSISQFFKNSMNIIPNVFFIYFIPSTNQSRIKEDLNVYNIYNCSSPGAIKGRHAKIEVLNYDTIGTLISYKNGKPIRAELEYSYENVKEGFHNCLEMCCDIIDFYRIDYTTINLELMRTLNTLLNKNNICNNIG